MTVRSIANTHDASPDTNALTPELIALADGRHGDPFSLLGRHDIATGAVYRTLQPSSSRVQVIDALSGASAGELVRVHPAGLFAGAIVDAPQRYRLRIESGGRASEIEDPYRFPPLLSDFDLYLLGEGRNQRLYDKLGAHPLTIDGVDGVAFAVWAPNARRVSVVGSWNSWDGRCHPMRLRQERGVWELFIPGIAPGALYKYELLGPDGALLPSKSDPVGFRAELRPRTASIVAQTPLEEDARDPWRAKRAALNRRDAPITIYEVHLGSWRRKGERGDTLMTYAELADALVPYVLDLGFTHIELMPVAEHPFDGSWGYQPIGLYAPTSRHGTPEEFRAFVDRCHAAGLGVIADWVPGHFPDDAHGLARFDGTALYEHDDPRQGRHRDWDTLIYNYGRREVVNHLVANALFWLRRFAIDGLRVDAVASMLYLDYSRKPGDWVPNQYGGNVNLEAVAFLRRLNELVYAEDAGAVTFAEESTSWPGVSQPAYAGGLGFGFKWNMGWMNDTLVYMRHEPVHRKYHQDKLTFGLLYAFSENFILPLSHDEVVHGKGSLLGKMPGDVWQKFANLRAYFGYMWTHPGKKLLFQGGEFAQWDEWSHDRSLDWHLLAHAPHQGVQRLVRDLNRLYRATPALHELDCAGAGFAWIDCSDAANSLLAYLRRGKRPGDVVVVVCNFTPVARHFYRIGVPSGEAWRELLNTDAEIYGGSGQGNLGRIESEDVPAHGHEHSLALTLPPLATLVLAPERAR
ncbi:MAG: 1,4-alpha-glucan branching protein GlgB [Alphaproteobacteria bacterium]|nr:1,4-alpha-glucan branching protein GlgB [Alphaproteobacteria bacterium]